MKYLMLVYGNEEIWGGLGPEDVSAFVGRVDAFNRELTGSGELLWAEGLVTRPLSMRVRDGAPVVSDGPYLETKEHVGSATMLDVASEERAREVARAYPGADLGGGIELWPVMDHGGGEP
ncbi:MAG: hypothetical protein JWO90_2703 [Solirubrobacterales bacterium]|nr:hypothetical protein [Solirubrobacterales bacterium]